MAQPSRPFVSRGGIKLAAALDAFNVDPTGLTCADLGANVGGFTDCLLQRGAAKVYAIDTGYGQFDWTLRNDERVVVLERSNALHLDPHSLPGFAGCDLVVIDLGWTRQAHAIPAALRWAPAQIVTLIKPHYEATEMPLRGRGGVLEESAADEVMRRVLGDFPSLGVEVLGHIRSPILGGASKGKRGNVEFLALLRPAQV